MRERMKWFCGGFSLLGIAGGLFLIMLDMLKSLRISPDVVVATMVFLFFPVMVFTLGTAGIAIIICTLFYSNTDQRVFGRLGRAWWQE